MRLRYFLLMASLMCLAFTHKRVRIIQNRVTVFKANSKQSAFSERHQHIFFFPPDIFNKNSLFNREASCSVAPLPNILNNGDFEQGATGFGTDYVFIPQSTGVDDNYGIRTNTLSFNPRWCSINNHTANGSYMLLVDGSTHTSDRFWFYSVPVKANTSYTFTYWYANLDSFPPASLQIKINGSSINTTTLSSSICNWYQVQTTWSSGSATSAMIEMNSQVSVPVGNDFAIDDISFGPSCE